MNMNEIDMHDILKEIQLFVVETFEPPIFVTGIIAQAQLKTCSIVCKFQVNHSEKFTIELEFPHKLQLLTTDIIKERMIQKLTKGMTKNYHLKPIKHNDVLKELCSK